MDEAKKAVNVVTAAFCVHNRWERDGSKGDMEFYSKMFSLSMALVGRPDKKSWEDIADAAHDLIHYVLSKWRPDDPEMPLWPEGVVLLNLALADVDRYPGGKDGVSQESILAARQILWAAYEALGKKEATNGKREGGDPDAKISGDGGGDEGRGPSSPG